MTKEELLHLLINPTSDRHFIMRSYLQGRNNRRDFDLTKVKTYFIEQMRELFEEEEEILVQRPSAGRCTFDPAVKMASLINI